MNYTVQGTQGYRFIIIKDIFCQVLLGVCNTKETFTFISVGQYGSASDCTILANLELDICLIFQKNMAITLSRYILHTTAHNLLYLITWLVIKFKRIINEIASRN